jgi:hypothetical protein
MTQPQGSPSRRRTLASFAGKGVPRAGFNFGSVGAQIYGLVLLLLVMVIFMLLNGGGAPDAVERVFASQQPLDEAQKQARREQLEKFENGALYDAKDNDDFKETPGYMRLLQYVDSTHGAAAAKAPVAFDRALAISDPDAQRGQPVILRGMLVREDSLRAIHLDAPLFGHTDIWRAVVTDFRRENGVILHFLDQPDHIDFASDVVEAEAIFYRLTSYERQSSKGAKDRAKDVPLLLAKSLRVVPELRRPAVANPAVLLIGGALILLTIWGVVRITLAHRKAARKSAQPSFSRLLAPHAPVPGDDPNKKPTP